jgi:sugar phosphate isomerase/epimerase
MATPEVSVQLYSVHKPLEADLDGTLGRLADIGLRYVEAFDFVRRADALKTAFDRYGLRAPTGHAILIEDQVATPDGLLTVPPPEETFAAAASLGVSIVIDPFVPPARWDNVDDIQRTADRLNARTAQAATHGLRVGYHNHDAELRSIIDGRPALEVFADLLDPTVALEVDLYWAAAGGQNPADLLRRLGDRVEAVHVKDGPMRPGISTAELPTDQVPAGQGDVPLAAALAAGHNIGYAVIEFDHYEGDIFDGIAQSYAFIGSTLGTSR